MVKECMYPGFNAARFSKIYIKQFDSSQKITSGTSGGGRGTFEN